MKNPIRLLAIWLLHVGAAVAAPPEVTDAKSLGERLRPQLPKDWSMSVEQDEVVLKRSEPVHYYNGFAFRNDRNADRQAQIKERLQSSKLEITLWVGDKVTREEFDGIEQKNSEAVFQARKDTGDGKLLPDEKFWREHPKYGYREEPILNAGEKSIYMKSTHGLIRWPVSGVRKDSTDTRWMNFYDRNVDKECQGLIDRFGKQFVPYIDE